jgi:predicted heme/steroid binding protein
MSMGYGYDLKGKKIMLGKKTILFALLCLAILLGGCTFPHAGKEPANSSKEQNGPSSKCISMETVKVAFKSNGTCLVALEGGVYDLTATSDWNSGMHKGAHPCGQEFSKEELEAGPHTAEALKKFRVGKVCG